MNKHSNNTVGTSLAPAKPKPLNQTQLKNLQALVDGDFSDLRASAQNDLHQRFSRRKEEIIRKYEAVADKQVTLNEDLQAIVDKARADLDTKLRARAAKAGAVITGHFVASCGYSIQAVQIPNDRDKELARLQEAYQRLQGQITTMVQREHRKISRMVLLQGITAMSANEIIADLPETSDIYQLIGSEAQLTNGDDIALLMGGVVATTELTA